MGCPATGGLFSFSNDRMHTISSFHESANPFQSFWWAGFECTDQLNCFGNRVDFLPLTGHLQLLREDYEQLDRFNLRTVREGIRWSQVERVPYQYDWSTVEIMLAEGHRQGIQQVWDLCHFGYPDDLTPLHPMFARRFTQPLPGVCPVLSRPLSR